MAKRGGETFPLSAVSGTWQPGRGGSGSWLCVPRQVRSAAAPPPHTHTQLQPHRSTPASGPCPCCPRNTPHSLRQVFPDLEGGTSRMRELCSPTCFSHPLECRPQALCLLWQRLLGAECDPGSRWRPWRGSQAPAVTGALGWGDGPTLFPWTPDLRTVSCQADPRALRACEALPVNFLVPK